ncbi:MAG TPA: hypothetical protein VI030_14995, partial [Propionibacteriaceae bacterium]
VAAEPYPELHLAEIDHLVGKSFEHGHLQPAQPRSLGSRTHIRLYGITVRLGIARENQQFGAQ